MGHCSTTHVSILHEVNPKRKMTGIHLSNTFFISAKRSQRHVAEDISKKKKNVTAKEPNYRKTRPYFIQIFSMFQRILIL